MTLQIKEDHHAHRAGAVCGSWPNPDSTPSRTLITVEVAGRTVHADLATRSIRRAVETIEECRPDGVALLLQGSLAASRAINEAGLAAQPR